MRMRSTTILTVALAFRSVLLVAPGISGPAQQEADWRELVVGIAHVPWELAGIDDPEVLLAELPAGFRERVYLPAEATVHGSLVQASGDVTVVATSSLSADELWPEYEREMLALGWRLPDERSGLTRSLADIALAWVFCGEGSEATLVTVTESGDRSRLRIDRHAEYRTGHCVARGDLAPQPPPPPGRPQERPGDARSFFRLRPPPTDAAALGACAGYTRVRASRGAVPSTMDRDELRAHYESQLEDGGWVRSTNDQAAAMVASSWERNGTRALLLLMPIDGAPGCWTFMFEQRGGNERP